MKRTKLEKKLENLKESDFLDGWYDSWEIWIQDHELSLSKRYMNCGFDSEQSAVMEMERIKRDYKRKEKEIYSIEIRKSKVRRLKKPISVS